MVADLAEHLLDHLHVCTRGDGQRRRRVPQFVWMHWGEAEPLDRRIETAAADHPYAKSATPSAGKHELVVGLAGDLLGKLVYEKARDRNVSPLMTLRRAPPQRAVYLGDCLGDRRATPEQVKLAKAQRGQLSKPNAGIGEKQHDQPVWSALGRERVNLLV